MTAQILVISHDVVGARMAGPGIRYLSLARVLGAHFPTVLAAPNADAPEGAGGEVQVVSYRTDDGDSLSQWVDWAEVIVLPGDTLTMFPSIEKSGKILVVDLYDPSSLEALYMHGREFDAVREERYHDRAVVLAHACLSGDFFICAIEEQRLWWLGMLEAYGRVNPATFDEDPSLRALIDLVPFGLPSLSCEAAVESIDIPGVSDENRVLLWGGGVWEWLDPLTAVRAMPRILDQCPDALLLFPGTRHPSPSVPLPRQLEELISCAEQLGLAGDRVLFGDWVPHASWPGYLLRADVGLSLHPRSLESALAFRTRVLDYIWAGLPSVVTRGDTLSSLIAEYALGVTVAPGDAEQVSRAVVDILRQPKEPWRSRFEQVQRSLTWERAAMPLVAFCKHPRQAPDKVVAGSGGGNVFYESRIEQMQAERDRLAALVKGYEQGRFIRTMAWLRRVFRKGGGQ